MPSKATKPIPQGYHSVSPYLIIRDAAKAIDFYKKAFGAVEKFRMAGPDGKIGHAEIQIGDSMIMISDENPQWGTKSPQTLRGSPGSNRAAITDGGPSRFVRRVSESACTVIGCGSSRAIREVFAGCGHSGFDETVRSIQPLIGRLQM